MSSGSIEAFKKATETEPKAKPAKAKGTKAPTKAEAPAQTKPALPPRAKADFSDDQKITMVKAPEGKGWLADRYALLKSGQTVGDALKVFTDQTPKLRRRRASIRALIEGGYISVK